MIETDTKIINLAEPNGRRCIRANVVLELEPYDLEFYDVEGEEKHATIASFEEELNKKIPMIDDGIITQVSNKILEDVYTADGKGVLRGEVMNVVNSRLPDFHVINIYLIEFVVQ